jgi:hypothetical protein
VKRLRMTMVYDFSWASDELTQNDVNQLAENFLEDPRGFLNLDYPEWDETVVVQVEEVNE